MSYENASWPSGIMPNHLGFTAYGNQYPSGPSSVFYPISSTQSSVWISPIGYPPIPYYTQGMWHLLQPQQQWPQPKPQKGFAAQQPYYPPPQRYPQPAYGQNNVQQFGPPQGYYAPPQASQSKGRPTGAKSRFRVAVGAAVLVGTAALAIAFPPVGLPLLAVEMIGAAGYGIYRGVKAMMNRRKTAPPAPVQHVPPPPPRQQANYQQQPHLGHKKFHHHAVSQPNSFQPPPYSQNGPAGMVSTLQRGASTPSHTTGFVARAATKPVARGKRGRQ